LDDEAIVMPDRLRLIALYLIYKDGLLPVDLVKLLLHAQLPPQHAEMLHNLDLLGVRTSRSLKDSRPPPIPLFPQKPPPTLVQEEYALSRFETGLQRLLDNHVTNTVDVTVFPYIKPPIDMGDNDAGPAPTSLRSAKPTWAKAKSSTTEPRQRVMVFMAGGATYSESRACYDMTRQSNKEVFLLSSHMLTPAFFLRQVGDLSTDKRKLGIPAEQPPKQAPAHLFERDEPPPAPRPVQAAPKPVVAAQPPTQAMGSMNLGSKQSNGTGSAAPEQSASKAQKDPEKKKRHFFSSKRG
jgi:syntaxin-binding protein 1